MTAKCPQSAVVRFATLLPGATPFKDIGIPNVTQTYKGEILVSPGDIRSAVIKDIPQRELANEVLAAALALASGVPVPQPYLVLNRPGVLRAEHAPALEGGTLLFASELMSAPSIASVVIKGNKSEAELMALLKPLAEKLLESDWISHLYQFDAWAANSDRHLGNILFDGNGPSWAIDHGRCFTGSEWTPRDLAPSLQLEYRQRGWLTPHADASMVNKILQETAKCSDRLPHKTAAEIAEVNYGRKLLPHDDFEALIDFLAKRVPVVPSEVGRALGQLV